MSEEKQLTQQEVQKTVTDYLSDPKVTENLTKWAAFFDYRFHKNRFSIEQVMKKTALKNYDEARNTLNLLVLKGYAVRLNPKGNEEKFKITLEPAVRLKYLQQYRDELNAAHAKQIESVENEIDSLTKEVAGSVIE